MTEIRSISGVIPHLLRDRAISNGDRPFLHFREEKTSFAQMEERSNRAANFLKEIGVRRGDKVCLMISNRPEFLELWFGLSKLGAIMIPMDPSLNEDAVAHIANHSDAKVIIVDGSVSVAVAHQVLKLTRIRKCVWIGDVSETPAGLIDYRGAIGAFPGTSCGFPETNPSDVMSIVYTPGTTGPPKGAMISQSNYCLSGVDWAEHVVRASDRDVFFTALPLSRIQTQTLSVMGSLISGCPLVLGEEFEARSFWGVIRRYAATVFDYTDGMIADLMALPEQPDDAANPARLGFGGSVPWKLRRRFENRFNVKIAEGFHLVECGGMCLANFGCNSKDGSIGKPLPPYEGKVVDEFGKELPTGLSGEIIVRSKIPGAVFMGYYREHDRTAENLRNDWFHTGDLGYVDTDGDFFFLDRKADCIRYGGEVFSSIDLERTIGSHPKVLELAATSVRSDLEDEDVRVFIVLRPGVSLVSNEIVEWCSGRMPSHLVPRYVELVSELPKTATGTIRKHELRQRKLREERVGQNA
jgi:crotonobetaine/carnitine-CoA ligase